MYTFDEYFRTETPIYSKKITLRNMQDTVIQQANIYRSDRIHNCVNYIIHFPFLGNLIIVTYEFPIDAWCWETRYTLFVREQLDWIEKDLQAVQPFIDDVRCLMEDFLYEVKEEEFRHQPWYTKDLHEMRLAGKFKKNGAYLYIAQCQTTGFIKLGKTTEAKKRISEVRKICSTPIQVLQIFYTDYGRQADRWILEYFKYKRVDGEWHDLSSNDIQRIQRLYLPYPLSVILIPEDGDWRELPNLKAQNLSQREVDRIRYQAVKYILKKGWSL